MSDRRRMYTVDKHVTDRADAAEVCGAVLGVLGPLVESADADVYSDDEAVMPDEVRAAQTLLIALGEERNKGSRDPRMWVTVARGEPAWTALEIYAPWSIRVDLWDAEHESLGEFYDSGCSLTVLLHDEQADALSARLAHIAPVALLSEVHARRREERRTRRKAAVQRFLHPRSEAHR